MLGKFPYCLKLLSINFAWVFLLFIVTSLGYTQSYYSNQDLRFRHYQIKDGLPSNTIVCMMEDSKGFLWLGTQTGLVRYDGFEFISVSDLEIDIEHSLDQASVHALFEDKDGFIWVGTFRHGLYRYNPKNREIIRFPVHPGNIQGYIHQQVTDITQDTIGNIWVSTMMGINILQKSGEDEDFQIQNFQIPINSNTPVFALEKDLTERIWAGNDNGLFTLSYNAASNVINTDRIRVSNMPVQVKSISLTETGEMWYSGIIMQDRNTSTPCLIYNNGHKDQFVIYELPMLDQTTPFDVLVENDEDIWIATHGQGIYSFNKEQFNISNENSQAISEYQHYQFANSEDFAIGRNYINCVIQDATGSIWIGTWLQGLFQISPSVNLFKYYSLPEDLSNPNHSVFSVLEYPPGQYWVSTYLNGLFRVDQETQKWDHFDPNHENGISSNISTDLFLDRESRFWCLSGNRALNLYNDESQRFTTFQLGNEYISRPGVPGWLQQTFLHGICQDTDGTLWVGSNGLGLFHFDSEKQIQLGHFLANENDSLSIGSNTVIRVFKDSKDNIWISCDPLGLFQVIKGANGIEGFKRRTPNVNTIYCITEDANGYLWLGTLSEGLIRYDPATDSLQYFISRECLPRATIQDIITDDQGYFWLVTPKGIIHFDPATFQCELYGPEYGLDFEQRLMNKGSQGSDGIIAGNVNGFYWFDPEAVQQNQIPPAPVFVSLSLGNKKLAPRNKGILPVDLPYLEKINLKYQQNDVAIRYAGLFYDNPQQLQFAYKMEGLQSAWLEVGEERVARFASLPSGSYTFAVKSRIRGGPYGPSSSLQIQILPPWWKSKWAYLLYVAVFSLLIFALYRFQLNRQLQLAETRKLQQLDQVKTRLYTNLTHEFRTPLTIILGTAKEVLENPQFWFREGLNMIISNAKQLQRLINQMLDLNKLEAGVMKMNWQNGDIIPLLKYLCNSFSSYAQQKNIRIHFFSRPEQINMDYDPDKMMHIFSNLISNAIKFTERNGDIYIHVESDLSAGPGSDVQNDLTIGIKDTGVGIDPAHIPHIFDRFYQADDSEKRQFGGSGIGLALTKELVQLMGGVITVKSTLGEGSEFMIKLPIHNEYTTTVQYNDADIREALQGYQPILSALESVPSSQKGQFNLLIVEDNRDVVTYLQKSLPDQYQCSIAFDGQEGWQKALEIIPDIIISDVMMPKMDGLELCELLKNDQRTSHIPVILLTAKADHEAKLSGLQQGADAYLTKPFDKKELSIRLEQMIGLRHKLLAKYQRADLHLSNTASDDLEDRFLKRVNDELLNRLADENFDIQQLCRVLGISRVQLHRKLKALTGFSTSHYIRRYKLQKAVDMLRTSESNVSEVAYAVGFKNPAYFTQVFTETFGFPPSTLK